MVYSVAQVGLLRAGLRVSGIPAAKLQLAKLRRTVRGHPLCRSARRCSAASVAHAVIAGLRDCGQARGVRAGPIPGALIARFPFTP
jgi:hypothetical protein